MAWADYWEMLDGRLWWELRKLGAPEEKPPKTQKQMDDERSWLQSRAKQLGLKTGAGNG